MVRAVAVLTALAGAAALVPPAAARVAAAGAAPAVARSEVPAAAEPWRWPARGPITRPFHVSSDRFAPRQHRGIDIAARAGAPVTSACGGRVRFAGTVGRNGRTVSVLCGPVIASYTQLGRLATAKGKQIAAGAPIGTAGPQGLHLGARRAGERDGYIDPLALLGNPVPEPPGPLPFMRPRHEPPLGPAPTARVSPSARGAAIRAPATASVPVGAGLPWPVYGGLPWPVYAGLLLLLPVASLPVIRGRGAGRRGRRRASVRRPRPRSASPLRPATASRLRR